MTDGQAKEIQKRFTYIAARLVALSAILIDKKVCTEDELNTHFAAADFQLENFSIPKPYPEESKSDEPEIERKSDGGT